MIKEKLQNFFKSDKFKDVLCNCIFIFIYLMIVGIITKGKYILGSTTDFGIQHSVIPDYFRTLFYQTKDLFPDFSFNLGAGQNIYYLSYYGFLSPIIIISYLFPMIQMIDYIIISMSLVVLSSTSLFYFYLRKNNYSHLVSFLGAFLFLCSSSFIFHSHRHIMFVNYMPFLILGFYGIDNFIKSKKSTLLIITITLMIFTSYYYSISGMLVLFLFGLFKFIRQNGFNFREIMSWTFKLILRFFIAVLISAILILPTLYTLFSGRTETINALTIYDLFKPTMYMLYGTYSMGLTFVSLIATVFMIFSKKIENKLLSIILLLISVLPFFNYILNGFLYINGKVLIPFVPLALINLVDFLSIAFTKCKRKYFLAGYLLASSLIVCIYCNLTDELMLKKNVYTAFNETYKQSVNDIINNDNLYRINSSFVDKNYINKVVGDNEYKTTMYSSTFKSNYKDVYSKLFNNPLIYRNKFMISSSNNIIFQMYMAEKYIYTEEEYYNIYKKIDSYNSINLYENPYTLPIGYATNEIINKNDFAQLSYPDNVINMLGRAIVDGKTNTNFIKTEKYNLKYSLEKCENLEYEITSDGYVIKAEDNAKINLKLTDDNLVNKLLFIDFNLASKNMDLVIKINDVTNKLTNKNWKYFNDNNNFGFVVINDNNMLEITLSKGTYEINNLNILVLDFTKIKDINKKVDHFIIDKERTLGDNIIGTIDVKTDSYFMLSIPYDKGFSIFVDGKEVEYFEANGAFIGFKIEKGNHEVKINYQAPYKNISCVISLIGVISFLGLFMYERRSKKWKKYQ